MVINRYCWSKNLIIWLHERHNWLHPTKSSSAFSWWPTPWKKHDINLFFPEKLMIKESCKLIGGIRLKWPHATKRGNLRCHLPLTIISMQKIQDINWLLPEILKIKESCNLIGWKAHRSYQTKCDDLHDYLHTKKLIHQLTLSRQIGGKRILQYDWMRGSTGHTQPKETQKIEEIIWFLPVELVIKEYCSLIG